MNKIIAIIPARGESKRLYKKNIKLLLGKPLVKYSIEQALSTKCIDKVYVSTEDEEIADISIRAGAEVINRPGELSQDTTSTEEVILHAIEELSLNGINPEYIVLLQPTSPLRYSSDIDRTIEKLFNENVDSMLSVCANDRFLWLSNKESFNYDYKKRPRSQDKEWEFIENGAIYVTRTEIYKHEKNRLGGKIAFYIQPPECAFQIDNQFDWELVEYLMKKYYIRHQYKNRLSKIKCFLMDVDGVLTDGGVYYDTNGERLLRFNRQDGKGIELLKSHGYDIGVISAERSEVVKKRLQKIGIDKSFLGIKDKLEVFNSILAEGNYLSDEVLFIGDDVQDLELIERAGFSACPSNAVRVIRNKAIYVCERSGGNGAVREVIDLLFEK